MEHFAEGSEEFRQFVEEGEIDPVLEEDRARMQEILTSCINEIADIKEIFEERSQK